MAEFSRISWTDYTFNPWTGCLKVSKGCKHCYAEAWAKRVGRDLFGAVAKRTRTTKSVWAKPPVYNRLAAAGDLMPDGRRVRRVFCASLADVFEDAPGPNGWRADVFDLIRACPWLDWQLLTKRPENIAAMLPADWGEGWPNVWLGTSIEDREVVDRARTLAAVPAFRRFVSYEPALGPVFFDGEYMEPGTGARYGCWTDDEGSWEVGHGGMTPDEDTRYMHNALPELDLEGIHWLICGGESGAGFRPMDLEWAKTARLACQNEDVAFFFKQISHFRNEQGEDALGAVLHGFPTSWDRADLDTHPVYAAEGSLLR